MTMPMEKEHLFCRLALNWLSIFVFSGHIIWKFINHVHLQDNLSNEDVIDSKMWCVRAQPAKRLKKNITDFTLTSSVFVELLGNMNTLAFCDYWDHQKRVGCKERKQYWIIHQSKFYATFFCCVTSLLHQQLVFNQVHTPSLLKRTNICRKSTGDKSVTVQIITFI